MSEVTPNTTCANATGRRCKVDNDEFVGLPLLEWATTKTKSYAKRSVPFGDQPVSFVFVDAWTKVPGVNNPGENEVQHG